MKTLNAGDILKHLAMPLRLFIVVSVVLLNLSSIATDSASAQSNEQIWTQTTFRDFMDGSIKENVLVIDIGGDQGDVKLAYFVTPGLKKLA